MENTIQKTATLYLNNYTSVSTSKLKFQILQQSQKTKIVYETLYFFVGFALYVPQM